MAHYLQPEKKVRENAVKEMTQLLENRDYSPLVNPVLFKTLANLGTIEIEHTAKRGFLSASNCVSGGAKKKRGENNSPDNV